MKKKVFKKYRVNFIEWVKVPIERDEYLSNYYYSRVGPDGYFYFREFQREFDTLSELVKYQVEMENKAEVQFYSLFNAGTSTTKYPKYKGMRILIYHEPTKEEPWYYSTLNGRGKYKHEWDIYQQKLAAMRKRTVA